MKIVHLIKSIFATALLAAVFFTFQAVAGPAPAGSKIENQGRVSYFNERLGIYESIPTNIVVTLVLAVADIEIQEDQTVYLTPDTIGQFAYFIRNTGNIEISPTLSLQQQGSDDFDLDALDLYIDQNGNGIVDPNDQTYQIGTPLSLALGQEIGVLITFKTPPSLQSGEVGRLEISAIDSLTGASSMATGTVIISTTGLSLEKEVSLAQANPRDVLRYSLELRNRGTNLIPAYDEIDGEPILVDGRSVVPGILVRDEIPLNTTFSQFIVSGIFDALYHVAGDDEHSYQSVAPADLGEVDAIAFFREGAYPVSFSTDFTFEVQISETVSNTTLPNIGETWQQSGENLARITSNPVRTRVLGLPASMVFVNDQRDPITVTGLEKNVGLTLTASACNRNSSLPETVQITIATTPEGDLETVNAFETGSNTGIFEVPSNIGVLRQIPVVQENTVLSGDRNTIARASIVCGEETVLARLVINPGGFAFQSASNAPIVGALVTLYDNFGTPLQSVSTDLDGFYVFEDPGAGLNYRIGVTPALEDNVVFPSQRKLFPGWGRNVHPEASYGAFFDLPGDLPLPFGGIDLPLDPNTEAALLLSKDVEADQATPGEIISYTLKLSNSLDIGLTNTVINDQLPVGLTYIEGSARLDGTPMDVIQTSPRALSFEIGFMPREGSLQVTYLARVDALAYGRLVNTAFAEGLYAGVESPPNPTRSNDARAIVRVVRDQGVFSDEGVILGAVYVDFNQNGLQDEYLTADGTRAREPGIPGVRIYFENGANVVTDINGLYSMPGMSPRLHVASISPKSLPKTVELHQTTTRDAFSPQSRFIRMLPGQVVAEYFAAIPVRGATQPQVLDELAKRVEIMTERYERLGTDSNMLSGTGAPKTIDFVARSIAASREASLPTETGILQRTNDASTAYDLPTNAVSGAMVNLARTRSLEAEIRRLSSALAFLDLSSDDVVNDDIITIRVKGPSAGSLNLLVNGVAISAAQISQRVNYAQGGVQALEYVAVRLSPGENQLELQLKDQFGNLRERREIIVSAPGNSAKIALITPPIAYADPSTPIPVLVRFVDAEGLPTGASMDITLETQGGGEWGARDIRPSEPGVQVFIDRGEALIDYYPPTIPGTHVIRVRNGLGRFSTEIILQPNTGERVLVGMIEGVVGVGEKDIDASNLIGYDETITGVNGALYLKGRIRGDALLTLRYDSDADSSERLFRDVDPERYYPIYGDNSERGFDAQSTGQLYVRIDKGQNYILYGDVDLSAQADAFQLGGYSRSLTGGHAHYENGAVKIDLMAGRTRQSQIIREFQGEGLSGPYDLDLGDYVEGSERVEIITRDVRQPSSILETVRLNRFADYRLDYFNDAILFNRPVAAFDEDGNPVFIRVTYEAINGSDAYWIYSGEVSYAINDRVSVGYREIRSEADEIYEDRRTVRAGYVIAEIGEYGRAELELAQSVNNLGDAGGAGRFKYEYIRNDLTFQFNLARTDKTFLGAGSAVVPAREEVNASLEWSVRPGLRFNTAVLYDRDLDAGDQRWGAEAIADWEVNPELSMTSGLRYLYRIPGGEDPSQSILSAVLGAEWRPEYVPGLSLGGEVEAEIADPDNMRARLEASRTVTENLRIYGRATYANDGAEFLDFSASSGMTETMALGFEYRFTDQILTFAEARGGNETGIASGVSAEWTLRERPWADWLPAPENAVLYASLEHFQPYDVSEVLGIPFGKPAENQSQKTTFTLGSYGEYNGGTGAVRFDTEGSIDNSGYTVYARQYWAEKTGAWTWAAENRFAYDHKKEAPDRTRNHLRFGAALREEQERLNLLFLAGVRYEEDPNADLDRLTGYWNIGGSWTLDPDTRLTFRQAGQYQEASGSGVSADTFLTLGQIGFERDFALYKDFDARIGAHASSFYDLKSGESFGGAGLEFGFVPTKNVMISAGYNWSNVEAAAVSNIYNKGAFLRLSVKLDDSLWDVLDRAGLSVHGNEP